MNRFISVLEKNIMPVAGRIAEQRHLQAIRDGIILSMPLLIIGSLFLILGYLPIPGYNEFMANWFGDHWLEKLLYPVGATFDIMALVVSFGVAYRLAEKYKVDALSAGAISLAAFLLATPYKVPFVSDGAKEAIMVSGGIPVQWVGSKGLFVAMILAIVSTEIYRKIIQKNIVIKLPDGVPPAVSRSFVALIPGFAVLCVIWIARLILEVTPFESFHNIVTVLLNKPLSALGGSLFGAIVAVLLVQLLWSTGLHGATIVGGVMGPIWLSLMDENRMVFQQNPHAELPNVITQQFFDLWIYIGGSGATLALAIAMLLRARSQQLKSLGRLAIAPGIFNINEPITFGMPIVMNPLLIIPFILVPIVLTIVSYVAMATGLVAKPSGVAVPWTTPIIISGYLATGGKISGSILQIINFFIALAIYYPFFAMWDRQKAAEERGTADIPTDSNTAKQM
ncbi:PTS cellobiose transporter subunit IIC [Geobacillus sp. 44B]|jgi:cellobiose PTS system EIIC component|uniref:PTS cellobiose transporter subunit IIC n=1 Tax=Saccharococcus caldoxylosilyticus TaxID=81408 RepID=UPI0009BE4F7C|nr:PTS cellobiose transporter subunit IIC [Parageobacillus caldoxylosilyticus]OQP04122.1 PTS system, cellobiose-specific IIC component [Geobacillus sp. 44B]QNU37634.1 PTS cellobiose transporter subunit IIC [Geobacillus sp. 44B]QXJ37244.1 Lichenan permease IIC component [Parageobacillus caldoxylosilyticus]